MKTQLATLTLVAFAFSACGSQSDPSQPGTSNPATPALTNVKQSACKAASQPIDFGANATLEAQVQGSDLLILHKDARYNCGEKLSMEGSVSGTDIVVKEVITNPNDPKARCECPFDLSAQVRGLAAGTYQLKVEDAAGNLVGSTSITIGAALEQVNAMQSACKGSGLDYVASAARATVGGGLLTITREDATYNCASKVEMRATVTGNTIQVKEVITNPDELALCMCTYDLSVGLKNLPAGTYTVVIFDADGKLVSTEQVTL
jgi:hypothetical protein